MPLEFIDLNCPPIIIQNVSSYYGKNWKVITIYLIIVTVITEIIVKMMVMLMDKDNNK